MNISTLLRRPKALPNLVKEFGSYLLFRFVNFLSRNRANKPVIVVHLDSEFPDIPDRRYFYLVLRTLTESGYYIHVVRKISFWSFRRARRYEKYALDLNDVRTISACPQPVGSAILFTDVMSHFSESGWKKVVEVDCDILSGRRSNSDIFMPYFMHPMQYQYDSRDRLNELRSSDRRVKIFFSGNIAEENYVNFLPGNKLTRSEICKALETTSGVEYVTDKEHFNKVFSTGGFTNASVINDRLVYAISDEEWLPALALCDFFLCLPGQSNATLP